MPKLNLKSVWTLAMLFCFGYAMNETVEDESLYLQKEFPEKCYALFGCFETGEPFYDPPNRPVVVLPFDLDFLVTKFLLFTPSNPNVPFLLNFTGESLVNSSFDPSLDTKIIIPGFATFIHRTGLVYRMKDAFLKTGNYNVILVDWSSSNQPPYIQAIANSRVVAAQIAHLITTLKSSMDVNASTIHIIGHSLGSHLAGMVGKRTDGLGRISGLDPAGPYFYKADPRVRLDAGDANFVDVIYTNGGTNYIQGLGLNEAIGHVNFYPNGGSQQPGCYMLTEGKSQADFDPYANGCSHQRALSFYISSIENTFCRFWAVPCLSIQHFRSGICERRSRKSAGTTLKIQMGLNAIRPKYSPKGQMYFLRTDSTSPFCLNRTNDQQHLDTTTIV